jgi:hypothetical protein
MRKLPSKVQEGTERISREVMSTSYVRKQNLKHEREASEDIMPAYFERDSGIKGSVPVLNKKALFEEASPFKPYRRSCSGMSTPNKAIKLDVESIKPNRVMNLPNREQ